MASDVVHEVKRYKQLPVVCGSARCSGMGLGPTMLPDQAATSAGRCRVTQ